MNFRAKTSKIFESEPDCGTVKFLNLFMNIKVILYQCVLTTRKRLFYEMIMD